MAKSSAAKKTSQVREDIGDKRWYVFITARGYDDDPAELVIEPLPNDRADQYEAAAIFLRKRFRLPEDDTEQLGVLRLWLKGAAVGQALVCGDSLVLRVLDSSAFQTYEFEAKRVEKIVVDGKVEPLALDFRTPIPKVKKAVPAAIKPAEPEVRDDDPPRRRRRAED